MENKTKGKTEQWNKIFKIYAHKEYIHDFICLKLIAELKRSRIFGKHFLVKHQAEKIWLWRHRASESPSVQILWEGKGREGRGGESGDQRANWSNMLQSCKHSGQSGGFVDLWKRSVQFMQSSQLLLDVSIYKIYAEVNWQLATFCCRIFRRVFCNKCQVASVRFL